MAKFGHLQEFDTDLEPITAYLERVELYFSANGIGEDKKLAILLSVIGPKTYGVLRNLLAPSRPQEKKFSEVTEVLIPNKNMATPLSARGLAPPRSLHSIHTNINTLCGAICKLAESSLPQKSEMVATRTNISKFWGVGPNFNESKQPWFTT
eukprot:Em0002g247a